MSEPVHCISLLPAGQRRKMSFEILLEVLGPEIDDIGDEYFSVFSQSIPSQNLGFVDSRATKLDLTISGRDLVIHQSPTILSSDRSGGTTGAVLWKITPNFASWITSGANPLFKHGLLSHDSSVLELGCGISGVIALSLAPLVKHYILTDQKYVLKTLDMNLAENRGSSPSNVSKGRKGPPKAKRGSVATAEASSHSNTEFKSLDWETDEVSSVTTTSQTSFDVIIACDCIYNDALIDPLIQTTTDLCKLRLEDPNHSSPTVCIVAQQLRSSEVFEDWLVAFHKFFRVWRAPDEWLTPELQSNSGFVVHFGVLR